MYIRCQRCGKILAEWIGPNCIEIRDRKRRARIEVRRVDIICDRCGTPNLILSPARLRRKKRTENPMQMRFPV
jgi:phage FluMu protein Com